MENTIQTELLEKVNQYVKAGETLDEAIIQDLWLRSETSSFIHPRGHQRGFNSIVEGFYHGAMGHFSERKLNVFDLTMNVYGDSAVVEFYWHFEARFKDNGQAHETRGRESQVYVRDENKDWKLVHIHYSNMPVTGEREGF